MWVKFWFRVSKIYMNAKICGFTIIFTIASLTLLELSKKIVLKETIREEVFT